MEALVNIRATSRFANRVQIARAQFRLQKVDGLEMRSTFSKPLRQPRTWTRSRLNLDKRTQVRETLLYRLHTESSVVASEETADVPARNRAKRIALAAIVSMFFRR